MICKYCNIELPDSPKEKATHTRTCKKYKEHKEKVEDLLTKEVLLDLYVKKCLSVNEIKEIYDVPGSLIKILLKKHDIQRRGIKESTNTNRRNNKIKETNMERYGTENVLSRGSGIREKMEMDVLKKYGVENVFQLEKTKDKIKQTNIERYGTHHGMKNEENLYFFKEILNNLTQEDGRRIIKKRKETCLERYGVDNFVKTKEYIDKKTQTCLERYGVDHPSQSKEIKKKMKEWGYNLSDEEMINRTENIKETNMERYGVPYGFLRGCENRLTKPHKKIAEYLQKNHIPIEIEVSVDRYRADILVHNKIIIEIYGDYGHANPMFYKQDDMLQFPEKCINVDDIGKNDKKREIYLRKKGYNFYVFGEYDVNRNFDGVKNELIYIIEGFYEDKIN